MVPESSKRPPVVGVAAHDLRARLGGHSGLERRGEDTVRLDEVDHRILAALADDARLANNALAERVGVAPSTCLARVRRLREAGVIRGFHVDVDPARAGRPLQAIIAVRMQGTARAHLPQFARELVALPGVLDVFLLGGAHDFFVHVAAPDTDGLNEFVITHLSANPGVALTETNLVFQHARGSWG
ncbi:Lrp/AsnC family transcriptional regulator [Isoptericola dokdonensis]|jgi:DNA-binding Lrp family transcriptional regulator|uniref:Leucine-responsive regulatory protein n=1 Tax=Isoptericola dokdonensis DS-3 TaxID=1300344 RepID=A0A168EMA0_9MICO|nr:Lrp/AsnC family transcriptional regulator [Isoptericola dokdonensis]ANC30216.1 Leucine-responsive regulatory protein [Isoptericola dokdonensis DS-3]